jgi:ligand-binding SRPBCC domain-containing protein
MPRIELSLHVDAPVERCFDLSRSIELHEASTGGTQERAIGGVTAGLIGAGEEVTWSARHFGVRQTLTSRITAYDRPRHFRDSQVRGAFRRFDHDHYFVPEGRGTRMTEVFDYAAPLGVLGRVAERLVLTRYMRSFLAARMAVVRTVAESERWTAFVPPAG